MTAGEFLDRLADKVARMKGIEGVVGNEDRMVIQLTDGTTITLTVEVA